MARKTITPIEGGFTFRQAPPSLEPLYLRAPNHWARTGPLVSFACTVGKRQKQTFGIVLGVPRRNRGPGRRQDHSRLAPV